jgi:hypothetical protein
MIPLDKKNQTKKSLFDRLAEFIPVWVQIVMCIGAVAVAAVPFIFPRLFPEATPAPTSAPSIDFTPTPDQMSESPSTSSQLPVSATPETKPLIVSAIPSALPGEDWTRNCIDSGVWSPFLDDRNIEDATPCYQLAQWGITGEDGRLIFVTNKSQSRAVEYGVFTPWRNWRGVEFSVQTKYLVNSEVWIGFFEDDTVKSNGIVFVIQPGDVIDVRQLPVEDLPVDNIYLPYADGRFNVETILKEGKIKVSVDGQGIISEWPISFTIKNMFIGYRSLPSTNLDASVFGLRFIE